MPHDSPRSQSGAPDTAPETRISPEAENETYLATVEQFWLLLRQRGIVLSARDIRWVERWRDAGIPARVVCAALADGMAAFEAARGPGERLPSALSYFKEHVAAYAARHRAAAAMAYAARAGDAPAAFSPQAEIEALLRELVEATQTTALPAVREAYRAAYRRFEALRQRADVAPGDADRFIDEVLSVAGGVAEEVVARLPEGERAAVVSGVDAAVAVAAQNLGLGVRARAELRRGALEQQLAARYGVMFLVPETAVRPGNRRLRWQSPCPAAGEKAQ